MGTPSIDELLKEIELKLPVSASKILVVDDEEPIRELLTAVLEREGLPVLTASGVAEGLRLFQAELPLVVLTDKNLPDGSGLQLIRRCKTLRPDAELILVTGYASMETAIDAVEAGAFGYLTKPFELDAVVAKVTSALHKSRGAQQNRFLLERLRASYGELFKLKVELELMNDVLREKRLQTEGEVAPLLAELTGPLAAAAALVRSSLSGPEAGRGAGLSGLLDLLGRITTRAAELKRDRG